MVDLVLALDPKKTPQYLVFYLPALSNPPIPQRSPHFSLAKPPSGTTTSASPRLLLPLSHPRPSSSLLRQPPPLHPPNLIPLSSTPSTRLCPLKSTCSRIPTQHTQHASLSFLRPISTL